MHVWRYFYPSSPFSPMPLHDRQISKTRDNKLWNTYTGHPLTRGDITSLQTSHHEPHGYLFPPSTLPRPQHYNSRPPPRYHSLSLFHFLSSCRHSSFYISTRGAWACTTDGLCSAARHLVLSWLITAAPDPELVAARPRKRKTERGGTQGIV